MRVTLVSPEGSLFDGDATSLVAPAFDGLVGVLPRHAPFLTLLGTGVLRITHDGTTSRFTVTEGGGLLQVVGDGVLVVAERVHVAPES